ncbi:GIY-YIG nuclease family protein [Vibrio astriarenae]|uniref:GIY-YIG nuclease family protein n=1 Tax=Vibrio astriarenae TaxID=1481923 RepID=A0A7Z2YEG3_9VIBR|nr:GIY-YIG nuclease family protein [Vibrio astriarenae]QIA64412.1 GIY-YIG nuclease family protein [Vibrio astriarenae]
MEKPPFVYMMASANRKALYIGVTTNLQGRVWQHKNGVVDGFSKKYQTHRLVFFEQYQDIIAAIAREKQLKNWHRQWKITLLSNETRNGWIYRSAFKAAASIAHPP